MNELVTKRIRTAAARLGLPHLAAELDSFARRADATTLGYLDFLDLVLGEELAVRDERRFRQGLRLSKLPHHKTIDDYDFAFQPELDPRKSGSVQLRECPINGGSPAVPGSRMAGLGKRIHQ